MGRQAWQDANDPPGPIIMPGTTVKWQYTVTTDEGNVPLSSISVTDDVPGVTPVYMSGDANSNGKLDLTETWIYEASGPAKWDQYTNTGTATGKYTDTAGHSWDGHRL